jgi:hypothetical protein
MTRMAIAHILSSHAITISISFCSVFQLQEMGSAVKLYEECDFSHEHWAIVQRKL